jgi:hypothetical protein
MKEMMKEYFDLVYKYRKVLTRILIVFVVLLVAFNGLFFVSAYYPKSCIVCHYMDPFYDQWKTSRHSGVNCLECHDFKPLFITVTTIKYLTNLYNPKPHAKVDNAACMAQDCHRARLDKPEEYLEGEIIFNHKEHIGKLKRGESLRCTSCHYQIVQGEHISVDKKVCFLCHFKGMSKGQAIGGCPSCHGTPKKVVEREGFYFSHDSYLKIGVECKECHINVASGSGDVSDEKCFECHVGRNRDNYDRLALHKIHVTQGGFECLKCHEEIKHGEVELVKVFEVKCDTCHKKLHSNQKEMYMGTGARGVPDTPSRMFSAQVSCDGCHTQEVQERESGIRVRRENKLEAERRSCVVCHGEKYDSMLDDWIVSSRELEKMMDGVRAKADKVNGSAANNPNVKDIAAMVDDIQFNYEFLKSGRGAHNIEYAWKIVKTAYTQIDLATKLLGKMSVPRPALIKGDSGYCTEFCHTRLGVPDNVNFEEMQLDFPHRAHIDDIDIQCSACHSPEKHKMRIVTKTECMACHHDAQDIECSECHRAQAKLYSGDVDVKGVDPAPDYMKEGDVDCTECHDLKSGQPQNVVTVKEKCSGCHDDDASYAEMALTWKKEILDLENRIAVDLEEATGLVQRMRRLGRDTAKFETLLESARKSYALVSKGRGIHNYELSTEMLEKALADLNVILAKR